MLIPQSHPLMIVRVRFFFDFLVLIDIFLIILTRAVHLYKASVNCVHLVVLKHFLGQFWVLLDVAFVKLLLKCFLLSLNEFTETLFWKLFKNSFLLLCIYFIVWVTLWLNLILVTDWFGHIATKAENFFGMLLNHSVNFVLLLKFYSIADGI